MNATTFRSRINYAIELVVVGVVYYLAARFGLTLTTVHDFAAFIWPPTGIALAAVYVRGHRVAPAIALAAFLVNVQTGAHPLAALAIAAGNTLEALCAVWLLHFLKFRPHFSGAGTSCQSPTTAASLYQPTDSGWSYAQIRSG